MANEEVPLLSPCPPAPPPMLSKNVGGKFKYLNRKNYDYREACTLNLIHQFHLENKVFLVYFILENLIECVI